MGLLEGIFGGGDGPKYNAPVLNPETAKLVDEFQKKNLSESAQDIAGQKLKGTETAASAMGQSPEQFQQAEAALGSYDKGAMGQALQSKYKTMTGRQMDKMKLAAELGAYGKRFQNTIEEAGYKNNQANFMRQNDYMAQQAQFAADTARNNVLSSLLGIAGTAAGMAMAGSSKGSTPSGVAPQGNAISMGASNLDRMSVG